jgi:hypothetical protein
VLDYNLYIITYEIEIDQTQVSATANERPPDQKPQCPNRVRLYNIVLKLGSVIDSVGVLGQWVNGRTTESLVEPHD